MHRFIGSHNYNFIMECCNLTFVQGLIALIVFYIIFKVIGFILDNRKLARWENTPKDVVILHCYPRATTLPNPSPFVLKVQTYLQMANIPYKIDTDDFKGPNGKSPWITFNGQHVADSERIIEFLNKKFDKNVDSKFTDEQLALSSSIRIMLEEHAFWGLALERFAFGRSLLKIMKDVPFLMNIFVNTVLVYNIKKQTFYHGIGRHSEQDIVDLTTKDLRITSKLLGNKKFILGDEPCVDDCAIFGFLAQALWGLPDSPYEKLVNSELKNLKEYCLRMKEKFYPNWEEFLAR